METKKKQEASVAANIRGVEGPGGMSSKDYDPEKPSLDESFAVSVIENLLGEEELDEKVKKVGDKWTIYDDDTGNSIGTYSDRETAWEKQRQHRKRKSYEKKVKKMEKKPDHGSKAPKLNYNQKPVDASKKESFERLKQLIRENVVSYMFEQQPNDEESVRWQNIVNSISRQTLASDKKLQNILKSTSKKELEVLSSSMNLVRNVLNKTKSFKVKDIKPQTDPQTGDNKVQFSVELKDNKQTLNFGLKIQNARPVIQIPDETSQRLNALSNDESKLLRAELISIQEKDLDQMNDVFVASQKRDMYLSKLEKQIDNTLEEFSPVQIVLLKNLLKTKYKGVK